MWNLILLSGLPNSGKSVQAKLLYDALRKKFNVICIDQGSYYVKHIPKIRLSSGEKIKNIDTIEAIDIEKFRHDVHEILRQHDKSKTNIFIINGQALRDLILKPVFNSYIFDVGPIKMIHIHLKVSPEISMQRHDKVSKSKNKDMQKKKMRELTFPFYLETMKQSSINLFLDGSLSQENIHNRIKLFVELFIRI